MKPPKEIAADIVARYSFVLNTLDLRNKTLTGAEFANEIAKVFNCADGVNKYAFDVADEYIESVRFTLSGVKWKFKGQ